MNHDACHCSDYKKDICPEDCRRAKLTQDLKDHWSEYEEIPMSFAHLKGSVYCIKWPEGKE